jgi:hypothetical protein
MVPPLVVTVMDGDMSEMTSNSTETLLDLAPLTSVIVTVTMLTESMIPVLDPLGKACPRTVRRT